MFRWMMLTPSRASSISSASAGSVRSFSNDSLERSPASIALAVFVTPSGVFTSCATLATTRATDSRRSRAISSRIDRSSVASCFSSTASRVSAHERSRTRRSRITISFGRSA
jgi:hypothetical protein